MCHSDQLELIDDARGQPLHRELLGSVAEAPSIPIFLDSMADGTHQSIEPFSLLRTKGHTLLQPPSREVPILLRDLEVEFKLLLASQPNFSRKDAVAQDVLCRVFLLETDKTSHRNGLEPMPDTPVRSPDSMLRRQPDK